MADNTYSKIVFVNGVAFIFFLVQSLLDKNSKKEPSSQKNGPLRQICFTLSKNSDVCNTSYLLEPVKSLQVKDTNLTIRFFTAEGKKRLFIFSENHDNVLNITISILFYDLLKTRIPDNTANALEIIAYYEYLILIKNFSYEQAETILTQTQDYKDIFLLLSQVIATYNAQTFENHQGGTTTETISLDTFLPKPKRMRSLLSRQADESV